MRFFENCKHLPVTEFMWTCTWPDWYRDWPGIHCHWYTRSYCGRIFQWHPIHRHCIKCWRFSSSKWTPNCQYVRNHWSILMLAEQRSLNANIGWLTLEIMHLKWQKARDQTVLNIHKPLISHPPLRHNSRPAHRMIHLNGPRTNAKASPLHSQTSFGDHPVGMAKTAIPTEVMLFSYHFF